jgi:hypothetical protein
LIGLGIYTGGWRTGSMAFTGYTDPIRIKTRICRWRLNCESGGTWLNFCVFFFLMIKLVRLDFYCFLVLLSSGIDWHIPFSDRMA